MNVPTFMETPDLSAVERRGRSKFAYEDVQAAIEQVYDLRSKVVRIGLMGTLLHRPDPDCAPNAEERREHLAILESEVATFRRVITVLETGHQSDGIPAEIAQWMNAVVAQNLDDMVTLKEVNILTSRVLDAVQSDSKNQSLALRQHRRRARAGFHEAITGLCLTLWRSYDKDQSIRLVQTQQTASTLGDRLNRLERIGTHVRLVSLNASVEASRIGDQGRGLALIAREFKGLAEEVTNLAQEAREDVNQMLELD